MSIIILLDHYFALPLEAGELVVCIRCFSGVFGVLITSFLSPVFIQRSVECPS